MRIIKILNPQIFWLEVIRKNSLDPHNTEPVHEAVIIQAGLQHIYPVTSEVSETTLEILWKASNFWIPVAVNVFRDELEQAESWYFRPQTLMPAK